MKLMKKKLLCKSRAVIGHSVVFAMICSLLLPGGAVWGQTVVIPPALSPLNQVAVPASPVIGQYVKNNAAAIRLGKALFWDMQVGSDGVTACATCHHSAGIDRRLKNAVHPGPDGTFEAPSASPGPNQTLQFTTADFPLHQRGGDVTDMFSPVTRDVNDVVGSQGVRSAVFRGITPGSAVDDMTLVIDPLFSRHRRVTGRNTPSMINAVFNFSNFWDGRANYIFNGENPFGPADPNAGIYVNNAAGTALLKQPVEIEFASLASQAVGPPLNDVEMSAAGRTFPELGTKMLNLVPLAKQVVHPGDSVLGALSRAVRQPDGTMTGARGLNTTYRAMIEAAFHDYLWNSTNTVTLPATINGVSTTDAFSQIESNFSLFWGLAVQAYMATLVSDQTPFDLYLAGDNAALTNEQKLGLSVFQDFGNCMACHGFSELTNASHSSIGFASNSVNDTIDLMFVADGTQVIYDNGFNNTGVTPIASDLGRGGNTPFTNPLDVDPLTGQPRPIPLNYSRLAELQALGKLPFAVPILPIAGPVPVPIPADFPVNAKGLFKAPGLRNVELTPPYFHNGGARTLDEVVEFYTRGGNFPMANITELDPLMMNGIPLLKNEVMGPVIAQANRNALVAFLKSLTDPRVAADSAPFDHPEIFIPEGSLDANGATDAPLTRLAARDANGNEAQPLTTTVPATGATLRPGVPSPQPAGTSVTFTASARGGDAGLYEYRFQWRPAAATKFTQGRAYSTTRAWTWNTGALGLPAGSYVVRVMVRHAGSTAPFEAKRAITYVLQ